MFHRGIIYYKIYQLRTSCSSDSTDRTNNKMTNTFFLPKRSTKWVRKWMKICTADCNNSTVPYKAFWTRYQFVFTKYLIRSPFKRTIRDFWQKWNDPFLVVLKVKNREKQESAILANINEHGFSLLSFGFYFVSNIPLVRTG